MHSLAIRAGSEGTLWVANRPQEESCVSKLWREERSVLVCRHLWAGRGPCRIQGDLPSKLPGLGLCSCFKFFECIREALEFLLYTAKMTKTTSTTQSKMNLRKYSRINTVRLETGFPS
jgi:hypothetical protein